MRPKPKLLRKVWPAVRNIMLAAAIHLERAVGEHRPTILNARSMVRSIQLHLVRAGQIMQPFPIRRNRCWKGVKRNFFAAIGPNWLAGDLCEHLEAVHEFDHAASFES